MWFAWKIVPLRYTKQLMTSLSNIWLGCDLLEKSYLCGIQNNNGRVNHEIRSVVICLKNRTFAVYKTTFHSVILDLFSCDLLEKSYLCGIQNNSTRLYRSILSVVICLKNRTFAVYKTTSGVGLFIRPCCDLLEKSYLCGIQNNARKNQTLEACVVICLKNRTFAVYKTTQLSSLCR